MKLPTQRIRLVAGTPIVVGERRLLPSVLVTTLEGGNVPAGLFRSIKLRPVSVVEEGPEGARWLEIPNATINTLSVMAAIGAGIAALGVLLIALIVTTSRRTPH
ncbi:MAG TPA: hypothetical protein PLJ78_00080 [Anaerolineae bacterium]|nr:hypothetical protein [Anaerolineae bacterium]HQK12324.1 hypothetical protein [Anaerolineae bacterium]